MTKARTLANFDSSGVLTSTSSLDATKLTGALPALNGSALTNLAAGGKVLQVNKTNLSTAQSTTSNTYSLLMTSNAITLASSSNSLLVDVDLDIERKGNATTTTPELYVQLKDSAGNVKDTRMIYFSNMGNANARLTSTVRLQALYSPSSTSETVTLHYKSEQGKLVVNTTSSITITELAS